MPKNENLRQIRSICGISYLLCKFSLWSDTQKECDVASMQWCSISTVLPSVSHESNPLASFCTFIRGRSGGLLIVPVCGSTIQGTGTAGNRVTIDTKDNIGTVVEITSSAKASSPAL